MIEVPTPTARINSGNITPMMAPLGEPANAAAPRISEAISVTSADSNRSAAMPAQSPTLSPDVVRDRGGVAGVVLGDALLHLAHEVRAHVGGLREDAAAHAHEHRQERAAEAEAHQHAGGVLLVDDDDGGGAEQTEAHREHAGDAAGAEREAHRGPQARLTRGVRGADVGADRQPHPHVAREGREAGAQDEGDRAPQPDRERRVHRVLGDREDEEQRHADDGHEHGQRAELAAEVGGGALLDRLRDLLHLGGALRRPQDLADQVVREHEGHERDPQDHPEREPVGRREEDLEGSAFLG